MVLRALPDVEGGGTARIERSGSEQHVELRGRRFGPFTAVGRGSLRASPDGRHWAFSAEDASGWRVFVDGRPGARWTEVGDYVWTADGTDVVYAATARGRWHVVGPREAVGPAFDGIVGGSLRASGDPAVTAYVALEAGRSHVVVGPRRFGPFEAAGALELDDEGWHHGFVERRAQAMFVHVDGTRHGPFEDVAELALGSKGGRFAATVLDDDGAWRCLADGELGPPWSRIGSLVFDDRGQRLAYAAASGSLDHPTWYVVTDTERYGPFEQLDHRTLVFARGGARLAFAARRGAHVWVYDDGVAVEAAFDAVSHLAYAPASEVLGFVGRDDGGDAVVLAGAVRERADHVRTLALSPDGARYAATIPRPDGVTLSVDGRHHDLLDVVDATVTFDLHGTHWAALVALADEDDLVILRDGRAVDRVPWDEVAGLIQASAGAAPLARLRARVDRVLAR